MRALAIGAVCGLFVAGAAFSAFYLLVSGESDGRLPCDEHDGQCLRLDRDSPVDRPDAERFSSDRADLFPPARRESVAPVLYDVHYGEDRRGGRIVAEDEGQAAEVVRPRVAKTGQDRIPDGPLSGALVASNDGFAGASDEWLELLANQARRRVSAIEKRVQLEDEQKNDIFLTIAARYARRQGALDTGGSLGSAEGGMADATGDSVETVNEEAAGERPLEADIYDQLTDEQKREYEELLLDREVWWTEIVSRLADEVGRAAVAAAETGDDTASSTGGESEDGSAGGSGSSSSRTGGNLFDLIGR